MQFELENFSCVSWEPQRRAALGQRGELEKLKFHFHRIKKEFSEIQSGDEPTSHPRNVQMNLPLEPHIWGSPSSYQLTRTSVERCNMDFKLKTSIKDFRLSTVSIIVSRFRAKSFRLGQMKNFSSRSLSPSSRQEKPEKKRKKMKLVVNDSANAMGKRCSNGKRNIL